LGALLRTENVPKERCQKRQQQIQQNQLGNLQPKLMKALPLFVYFPGGFASKETAFRGSGKFHSGPPDFTDDGETSVEFLISRRIRCQG
jgi:hypothetical protein